MTTIAFKDGVLAADTQVTEGNEFVGTMTKIGRLKCGVLYGAAGRMSVAQAFMKWVEGGMKDDPPGFMDEDGDQNGKGFIIVDGEVIEFGKPGSIDRFFPNGCYAIGSGSDYAKGVMKAGLSAAEAVRVASQIDLFTGGEITVLKA